MDWIVLSPSYAGPEMWGNGWEQLHGGGIKGYDWWIFASVATGLAGYAATSRNWLGRGLLVVGAGIALFLTILLMKDSLNPSLPVFFRLNLGGVKQVPGVGYYVTLIGEISILMVGFRGIISRLKLVMGASSVSG